MQAGAATGLTGTVAIVLPIVKLPSVLLCRKEYDVSQHKWLSHVFIGVNEAFKYEMSQLQADQLEN